MMMLKEHEKRKTIKDWARMFNTYCEIYSIEPVLWVDNYDSVNYKYVEFIDIDEDDVFLIMSGKRDCELKELIAIYNRSVATLRTEIKWRFLMRNTMTYTEAARMLCRFSMIPTKNYFDEVNMKDFFVEIDFEGVTGPQDYYLKRMCGFNSNKLRHHNWCSCQLVKVEENKLSSVVIAAEYYTAAGAFKGGACPIEESVIAKPINLDRGDPSLYVSANLEYIDNTYGSRVSDITFILHDIVGCSGKIVAVNDGMGAAYAACKHLGLQCISSDPNEAMVLEARKKGNVVDVEGSHITIDKSEGIVFVSHSEQFDPVVPYALLKGRKIIVYETGCIFEGMSQLHHHGQGVYSNFAEGELMIPLFRSKWPVKKNNLNSVPLFLTNHPHVAVDDANMLQTLLPGLSIVPELRVSTTSPSVREVCKLANPPIKLNDKGKVPCLYKRETNISAPLYFSVYLNCSHTLVHAIGEKSRYYYGLKSSDYITIAGRRWGKSEDVLFPHVVDGIVVQYVKGKEVYMYPVGGPPGKYGWKIPRKKGFMISKEELTVGSYYVTHSQIKQARVCDLKVLECSLNCACGKKVTGSPCLCEFYVCTSLGPCNMRIKNDNQYENTKLWRDKILMMKRVFDMGNQFADHVIWERISVFEQLYQNGDVVDDMIGDVRE